MKSICQYARSTACTVRISELMGDLVQLAPSELLRFRNFGQKSLDEIISLFADVNLPLGVQLPDWEEKSGWSKVLNTKGASTTETKLELSLDQKASGWSKVLNTKGVNATETKLELSLDQKAYLVRLLSSTSVWKIIELRALKRVGDLAVLNYKDLIRTWGVNWSGLNEIEKFLEVGGLSLGTKIPNWSEQLAVSWEVELGLRDPIFAINPHFSAKVEFLEDELQQIVTIALAQKKRSVEICARLFGFDGTGAKTQDKVAEEFGLTRQRVHQAAREFHSQIHHKRINFPILERAHNLVLERVPALNSMVEAALCEAGITAGVFDSSGIFTALEQFGIEPKFEVGCVKNIKIVANDTSFFDLLDRASDVARALISSIGCAQLAQVANDIKLNVTDQPSVVFLGKFLECTCKVKWLDRNHEWFTIEDAKRNRLVNLILKVLSVSSTITLPDLYDALKRDLRLHGVVPPCEILVEFCRGHSFAHVSDQKIEAQKVLSVDDNLGETERCFYEVMRQRGPVMHANDFRDACIERGMNRNTFYQYLTYSPILRRLKSDRYSLVGQGHIRAS
jgi:hypothetical protein